MSAFWGIIASNAIVATVLAIAALLLGRIWRNAAAAHVLWVVVLLKLFTPPLVTAELPLALTSLPPGTGADVQDKDFDAPVHDEEEQADRVTAADPHDDRAKRSPQRGLRYRLADAAGHRPWSPSTILAAIWICGSCSAALGYAVRIRRFARVIHGLEVASPTVHTMAAQLSSRMGLRRTPDVLMTSRALPPLVWSIGLFPRVILPSEVFARLSREAQVTILAHELAHIRRRDRLVRLLELAASTVFWWHPVVWWASRQLRELEEQCCDSHVLEIVPHQTRTYVDGRRRPEERRSRAGHGGRNLPDAQARSLFRRHHR